MLSFELGTFLANLASFAILVWALRRWAYPRILAWLEARRKAEEERLASAQKALEQAQALVAEREQLLAEANRTAREILARGEAEAKRALAEARLEARAQAQAILQAAQEAARRLQEQALEDLRRSYAELVVLGAAEVLGREVKPQDHERLLAELTGRLDARVLS